VTAVTAFGRLQSHTFKVGLGELIGTCPLWEPIGKPRCRFRHMKLRLMFAVDPYGACRVQEAASPGRPCLAFYIGCRSGATTCRSNCEHCFIPPEGPWLSPAEAKCRIGILRTAGYPVVPMIPDTFADNGSYLRSGILFRNKLYDQNEVKDEGVAWTSGIPLLQENWSDLLHLASDNELQILTFTCPSLSVGRAAVKGGMSERALAECLQRVQAYNDKQPPARRFLICLTLTIAKYNCNHEALFDFYTFASEHSADLVRLNRLIDFSTGRTFERLVLTAEDTSTFFKVLDKFDVPAKLAIPTLISSDFGASAGTAISGLHLCGCTGGIQMFAVLGEGVYPCVEYLRDPVGRIDWEVSKELSPAIDPVRWHSERLSALREVATQPGYDGCIGHALTCGRDHARPTKGDLTK